jgi:hypothetical protein
MASNNALHRTGCGVGTNVAACERARRFSWPRPAARLPWNAMKPRARRITIGAAALGAVLCAVLTVANWGTDEPFPAVRHDLRAGASRPSPASTTSPHRRQLHFPIQS